MKARTELWQNRFTYRRLETREGAGFVIRLLNISTDPDLITTVARQPGHKMITTETLAARHEYYPESTSPHRYYPTEIVEPESREDITDRLRALIEKQPEFQAIIEELDGLVDAKRSGVG